MKSQLKTTQITARQEKDQRPEFSRTETFTEISTTKMTSIVCTPYRTIEVLEGIDGIFAFRETSWQGSHAGVAMIYFKPHELLALRNALNKLKIMDGDAA